MPDPLAGTFAIHLRDDRAWTKNHLCEWFEMGCAPFDLTFAQLLEFWDWLDEHAVEFGMDAGWPTLLSAWEARTT